MTQTLFRVYALLIRGLKNLIQFHIGAEENGTASASARRRMRKADYKSRGETSPPPYLSPPPRNASPRINRLVLRCEKLRPDRRCGSFRGRHAKTTMSNAPRSFTAHSATSSRARLTQPGDPLYLLHGKSARFRNHIASQNCLCPH